MPEEKTMKKEMSKKILICDDDKGVTTFLEHFLKKEGYSQVEVASSGKEALEKIARDNYQLVLLDIRMPEMDGIQTLKKIKEIDNKIGVIMITAFPEAETTEQALKMGAYDYIVKPFDLAYLKLAVLTKIATDIK